MPPQPVEVRIVRADALVDPRARGAGRARAAVARHAGLDPARRGARVRARPGGRARSSRAAGSAGGRRSSSFAALFAAVFVLVLVTAGPVWDADRRVRPRAAGLLGRAARPSPGSRTSCPPPTPTTRSRDALKQLAAGLPDAASALLGLAGGVFGSVLSLVTLTFLALFLLMERPAITDWLFGYTPPETEARWRPVVEDSIQRDLLVADRQRRDLGRRRRSWPGCRRGRSGCRSRSCWP